MMRTYTRANDDVTHNIYLTLAPDGHLAVSPDTVARLLEFAGFTETTGRTRDPYKA